MKRTIARVVAMLMTLLLLLPLAGCKSAVDKMDEAVNGGLGKMQEIGNPEYKSYQEILDAYSVKMEKKGKVLAKELTREAPARYKQDGNTLTKLLKEKTQALNEVYQEGLGKLSQAMLFSEDSQDVYQAHKDSLYGAYRRAEDGIMDAYVEALDQLQ